MRALDWSVCQVGELATAATSPRFSTGSQIQPGQLPQSLRFSTGQLHQQPCLASSLVALWGSCPWSCRPSHCSHACIHKCTISPSYADALFSHLHTHRHLILRNLKRNCIKYPTSISCVRSVLAAGNVVLFYYSFTSLNTFNIQQWYFNLTFNIHSLH